MRGKAFAVAGVLIVAAALVAWRSLRPPAFHAPASVAALAAKVDETVPASLRKHGVPGASVAVVHAGQVRWAAAYGVADAGSRAPMTPDTVMQIASVSKPVAAYALLRAGTLPLDAPIERFTGAWRLPPSDFDAHAVTLRRLLSHTAGIDVDGYGGLEPATPLPSTRASLAGASGAGRVRLVAPPGKAWRYSGGGYTIAQLAAETRTRAPFSRLVEREVFRPLGMTRSGFACTTTRAPAGARGHDAAGAPLPAYRFAEQAAAGVCSTAPDTGRFAAALLRGPVAQAMGAPAADTGGAYGLGLHVEHLRGGARRLWHDGSNRGWRSRIEVFPGADWALVVLTNSDNGRDVIADVVRLVLR